MIVLDTNVVSETMRKMPNAAVVGFLSRRMSTTFASTILTLFEPRFGMELLPASVERRRLEIMIDGYVQGTFGPILPIDNDAAELAAAFRAKRQQAGRPVGVPDSLIAGIALRHGAVLATRNVRDFEASGLEVVDPWQVPSP